MVRAAQQAQLRALEAYWQEQYEIWPSRCHRWAWHPSRTP